MGQENILRSELISVLINSSYKETWNVEYPIFQKCKQNGDTITVSLKPTCFIKYYRCRTIKDGWTENTYEYTEENIKNFHKLI